MHVLRVDIRSCARESSAVEIDCNRYLHRGSRAPRSIVIDERWIPFG